MLARLLCRRSGHGRSRGTNGRRTRDRSGTDGRRADRTHQREERTDRDAQASTTYRAEIENMHADRLPRVRDPGKLGIRT